MGILRFVRRLNCFSSGKRRSKSKEQMERDLSHMQATIRAMEEKVETARWIIDQSKQQQLAEEREQMVKETRNRLMDQVEQTEIELTETLKHRQLTMANIIETGLRKMALEKNLQAMEKKATFFWMELFQNDPDPRKTAKTWRQNLRQMRSQNDMHRAVPQPPLFPILDFDEEELIWLARELGCEDVKSVDCQENFSEMATEL